MVCRDVFVDVSVSGSVLFVYFVSVKEFGLIGRKIPCAHLVSPLIFDSVCVYLQWMQPCSGGKSFAYLGLYSQM